MDNDTPNTEIWYCNYCKIIVTNGDVRLIDNNKIQSLLIGFSLGCLLTGASKQKLSKSYSESVRGRLRECPLTSENINIQSLCKELKGVSNKAVVSTCRAFRLRECPLRELRL